MSRILHLLAHDLRTHRVLLLAWVAVVVAHPLLALLPWSQLTTGILLAPAALIVAARLALGVVVLGSILQQDSPIDERAFWRTRPIAALEMAAAKLALAGMLFVFVPLVVVLVTAMAVGVPWSHWLSMVGQVLFTDAALAGLTMAIATRTRRVSTLVLAIIGVLLGTYLLLIAAVELRQVAAMAAWVAAGRIDPDLALPTMWIWASIGLWIVAVIGFAGYRRRNAFALVAAATIAMLLITWFVPRARLHQRVDVAVPGLTATVDIDRLRAERISGRGGSMIAIVAEPAFGGVRASDRAQAYLLDGRLSGPGLDRPARGEGDPRSIVAGVNAPNTPLLAVLTTAEFAALAGKPVHFSGRLNVDVNRATLVAAGPLTAGTALDAVGTRLVINRIREWSDDVPLPVAESLFVQTYVPGRWRMRGYEYRLRDVRSGCHAKLFPQSSPRAQIAAIALLPTLARPFAIQLGTMVAMDEGGCRPVPSNSIVELYELSNQLSAVPVRVDFTMPSVVEPARGQVPRG